jgi:adenylate kinase
VKVLVLLGAPGAGKGTQADILARNLGLPRIATGDLFRSAVRAGTPLGVEAKAYMERGEFVPDEITVRMLLQRISAPDAARGVILDGFPRNRTQAEALEAALAARGAQVEAALYIEVPEADLLQRLSGRWLCQAHGHTYHDTAYPPRSPGVCDVDGSPLAQRDDDRPEIVAARLRNQLGSLEEVVEFYRPKGLLRTVDGRRPIAAVTADLLDHVELRPYWRHA